MTPLEMNQLQAKIEKEMRKMEQSTKHYKKFLEEFYNDNSIYTADEIPDDKTIIHSQAITAMLMFHDNILNTKNITGITEVSQVNENDILKIWKENDQAYPNLFAAIKTANRLVDAARMLTENSNLLTSMNFIKVRGQPYWIPLSRMALEYRPGVVDENNFYMRTQFYKGDVPFKIKVKDIQEVYTVVLTSMRRFKKAIKTKQRVELHFDKSNKKFNEELI